MKKSLIALLAALSFAAFATPFDALPRKATVTMSYAPGGNTDSQMRHLQEYLQQQGVQLTIQYRPGGNGMVMLNQAPQLKKDGSDLVFAAAGFIAYGEITTGQRVFEPLTITGAVLSALVVKPGSKYGSLEALEQAMKAGAPDLNFGQHSVGTQMQYGNYFRLLGVPKDPVLIAYKSPVESSLAVVQGILSGALVPYSVAEPLIADGKLEVAAVAGPRQVVGPKGVPNLNKKYGWTHPEAFVIGVPNGTDIAHFAYWLDALREYYKDPKTIEWYKKQHLVHSTTDSHDAAILIEAAKKVVETTVK